MAGAPVTMQSVLQFLTKYATPANAISAKVQQYQSEVPMRLRCFGPASSVRSTNVDIDPPPVKKSRRVSKLGLSSDLSFRLRWVINEKYKSSRSHLSLK